MDCMCNCEFEILLNYRIFQQVKKIVFNKLTKYRVEWNRYNTFLYLYRCLILGWIKGVLCFIRFAKVENIALKFRYRTNTAPINLKWRIKVKIIYWLMRTLTIVGSLLLQNTHILSNIIKLYDSTSIDFYPDNSKSCR